MSPTAGPSSQPFPENTLKRSISGQCPGLLDPLQPSRLLRVPNAKLSFAAFDPRTATADKDIPDLRKLSINEELYRPKRVVIETAPDGSSFWRFVPRARRDDDVEDEGHWPRVVNICGELVGCSQDQWDIYKLDPAYECLVHAPPKLSTVLRVEFYAKTAPSPQTQSSKRKQSPELSRSSRKRPNRPPLHKRSSWSSSSDSESEENVDDDEEEEVEEMIVDEPPPPRSKSAGAGERTRRMRAQIDKERKLRREKLARTDKKLREKGGGNEDKFPILEAEVLSTPIPRTRLQAQSVPPPTAIKRKADRIFESFHPQDPYYTEVNDDNPAYKRTRTLSPRTTQRKVSEKKQVREKKRKEERNKRFEHWKQRRNDAFMEEVYAEWSSPTQETALQEDLPHVKFEANGASAHGDDYPYSESQRNGTYATRDQEHEVDNCSRSPEQYAEDELASRQAAIEESRRKLAELEKDRPLWEEEAKKRRRREQAEEEACRVKAAERRRAAERQAEAERRAKEQKEEQDAKERAEKWRQEREAAARRDRERRQRQQRWSSGYWTTQRALERYKDVCERFDATKFSHSEPLYFDDVPWPVLHQPTQYTVEDVDWAAVEKFFDAVKPKMRPQDFKTLVQSSHRRFHPDRWRSRNLLKSITDEAERCCLEVAANTVAQALTPLWTDLKG